MAESSAARKMRPASPVRVLGNTPGSQVTSDNDRARAFIRERQGRVLPTLNTPFANDNADEDEEGSDEYGAGQKESEARMRSMNRGADTEDVDEEDVTALDETDLEEIEDMTEYVQDDNEDEEESAEELDARRAIEFQRQRSQDIAAQQAAEQENDEDEAKNNVLASAAERMAKQKVKSSLKMRIGATGAGLVVILLWWNYEVFIEGGQPTWKILLVVMLDLLSIASAIIVPLMPIIYFLMVAAAIGAALPAPLRDALGSLITSVL